ncbi:RES family NAD+ phosphorylase [Phyllobacterium sp. 0TCS1.6C]|uniref:RES family NAD+ phosphorylase n=1 Tax=unclassified Phyllobacterium TaxID=2638441 RepID=UPI0022642AF1|nr:MULTISPECIES: RES family NAD+ phosphorylase [unclassified Phyllobacterium]MCX8280044.1 RES family NAD+ phosphorylase [Phyllobacterium sp. 0TCS1.6C]MCX8294394.1 RES family NAD+ phosphorylase [Phyllobacterium sp. 0TCS1.6A]
MRYVGTCYRAHDPRWAFKPISGDGAAIRGARFNPKGVPALYLGLGIMTAVKEANQGFAHRIDPCVLCSYEVDCENVADLATEQGRAEHSVDLGEMACGWAMALARGERPASWSIYDRLKASGIAGILVPSFAPGAEEDDTNLVLWRWGQDLPHKVTVFDPSGRLPKDQLSWR